MKILVTFSLFLTVTVASFAQKVNTINVGVYSQQDQKLVDSLSLEDFKLLIGNKEQKIISVEKRTKPLSIIVLSTLGEGKSCGSGFKLLPNPNSLKNSMGKIANTINKNLQTNDELAIFMTDEDVTKIRKFDNSNNSIINDFLKAESFSLSSEKLIETEELKEDTFGNQYNDKTYYLGVEENFVHKGLKESIEYLRKNKNTQNYPVILMLRSIYNAKDISPLDAENLKLDIFQDDLSINWFGESDETPFMKLVNRKKIYNKLPDLTGGIKEPCSVLKSEKLADNFDKLFNQLRTRYEIKYEMKSDNLTNRLQDIQVKLSNKGKKKTKELVEIRHRKFVS